MSTSTASRRHHWLGAPAMGAALIVGLLLGAPLALGSRFLGLDHTRNLLTTLCAHQGIGAEGALLDEALGGGGPLLEDPLGMVFSPVARALAPLPPESAASVFTWLWLVLGAAAATYLGGSFGLSRRARLALGIAWPLCGTALDLILHGPYVVDVALVPLVWGGLRQLRRAARVRARDACAVALGLGLLGVHGELQACLYLGLVGVAEAIAAAAPLARVARAGRARALIIAAALASGSLLAGLQALPTAGLGAASARSSGVESTSTWSLAPPEAFGVLWPLVATARSAVGASLVTAWHGSATARAEWNTSPYLGLLAIAAALSVARARRARPLVALAVASAVMAVGNATPLYGAALAVMPPLALFRYPAKYFLLTSLAVLVLAALALDAAARSRALRRRMAIWCGVLAGWSALALVLVLARRHAIDAAELAVARRPPFAGEPSLADMLLLAGTVPTLFALAVAALLARPTQRARLAVYALPLSFALAARSLVSFGAPLFDPEREPPLATPARALAAPSSAGGPPAVLCIGRDVRALHVDLGDRALAAEGDLMVDIADHKPDIARCGGPATPHIALPSSQHLAILLSRALDETRGVLAPARALGCTHVVTRAVLDDPTLTRVPLDAPQFAAAFYQLADPLPDAAVARDARLVASDEQSILDAVLRSPDARALLAIVDDPTASLPTRFTGGRPEPLPDGAGAGTVHAAFDRPDRGTVRVEGLGGAVVALRRPWWPGFVASQAGRPVPVVRVAGAQLGLVIDDVSAGSVAIRYRARFLLAGFASAAAGALAMLVALARHRRLSTRAAT